MIKVTGEDRGAVTAVLIFLVLAVFMLMWLTVSVISMRDTFRETKTEVRILQMHLQDQNAILIRQGIARPKDFTTGPTDPDKLKVAKE